MQAKWMQNGCKVDPVRKKVDTNRMQAAKVGAGAFRPDKLSASDFEERYFEAAILEANGINRVLANENTEG